jgi:O-antigen/teichoic acid export membrane protein
VLDKKFASNFVTMLTGNTISQLIPFLVASFLTRIYLPSEFGVFSNVLALSTLFGIVSCGRLELAIPLPKEKNESQDILFTALFFTLVITILSFVIFLFKYQIGTFYKDNELSNYLLYLPICVLSFGLLGVTNNWILRNNQYKVLSTIKIIQSVINNFGALLLGIIGFGIHGLLIAWLFSQFIPVIYILFKEKISWKKDRFTFGTIKNVLKNYKDFPLINSLHAFTDIFATQVILFWMISAFFGEDNLGLFAQMNKYIKAPIVLITSAVSQVFYVEVSKAINDKRYIMPYLKQALKTTIFFAIPFSLLILFFAPQLFSLYLGEKFIDYGLAGQMAQAILPILFLMFVISPISGLPILFKRQAKAFSMSVFGYTIGIVGLFIGDYFNLNIFNSLLIYSSLFSIYYLMLLLWYVKMIKSHDSLLKI